MGAADIDFDYFLGGFLRSPIFDEFSIGKKSGKNHKIAAFGRPFGVRPVIWVEVGE